MGLMSKLFGLTDGNRDETDKFKSSTRHSKELTSKLRGIIDGAHLVEYEVYQSGYYVELRFSNGIVINTWRSQSHYEKQFFLSGYVYSRFYHLHMWSDERPTPDFIYNIHRQMLEIDSRNERS